MTHSSGARVRSYDYRMGLMRIATERVFIRPPRPTDLETFMEYRNDLDWMQYQGFKGQPREVYEDRLFSGDGEYMDDGLQLAIADRATDELLGDLYLKREGDTVWVGYAIHPKHALQGYVFEAMCAIITWGRYLPLARIKASVMAANHPSRELLKKLGFTCTGMQDGELIYEIELEEPDW